MPDNAVLDNIEVEFVVRAMANVLIEDMTEAYLAVRLKVLEVELENAC